MNSKLIKQRVIREVIKNLRPILEQRLNEYGNDTYYELQRNPAIGSSHRDFIRRTHGNLLKRQRDKWRIADEENGTESYEWSDRDCLENIVKLSPSQWVMDRDVLDMAPEDRPTVEDADYEDYFADLNLSGGKGHKGQEVYLATYIPYDITVLIDVRKNTGNTTELFAFGIVDNFIQELDYEALNHISHEWSTKYDNTTIEQVDTKRRNIEDLALKILPSLTKCKGQLTSFVLQNKELKNRFMAKKGQNYDFIDFPRFCNYFKRQLAINFVRQIADISGHKLNKSIFYSNVDKSFQKNPYEKDSQKVWFVDRRSSDDGWVLAIYQRSDKPINHIFEFLLSNDKVDYSCSFKATFKHGGTEIKSNTWYGTVYTMEHKMIPSADHACLETIIKWFEDNPEHINTVDKLLKGFVDLGEYVTYEKIKTASAVEEFSSRQFAAKVKRVENKVDMEQIDFGDDDDDI